ncbi:MAG: twin-arginine translocase TatA/TatE family subunit [Sedimenticolaceae bacterium]|jgi:hypothetical protein
MPRNTVVLPYHSFRRGLLMGLCGINIFELLVVLLVVILLFGPNGLGSVGADLETRPKN